MLPVLSVYIGQSEITILKFESFGNSSVYRIPFVFMGENYGLDYHEDFFMNKVLDMVCSDMGISRDSYKVILGSYPEVGFKLDGVENVDFVESMSGCRQFFWLLVDKFTVMKHDHYSCEFPVDFSSNSQTPGFQLDPEAANFLSNLSIFKSVAPTDSSDWGDLDRITRKISMNMKVNPDPSKTIVLTGGRFSGMSDLHNTAALLILDLIRQPGIFKLEIDENTVIPPLAFLEYYISGQEEASEPDSKNQNISSLGTPDLHEVAEFLKVGTLLNAPGGAECLIQSDAGTKQFLEVPDGEFFFVPFGDSDSARVSIKNPELGNFEQDIEGGKIGFVIDSRKKIDGSHLGDNSRIKFARQWEKNMSSVEKEFD